jgi:hypothetical protein
MSLTTYTENIFPFEKCFFLTFPCKISISVSDLPTPPPSPSYLPLLPPPVYVVTKLNPSVKRIASSELEILAPLSLHQSLLCLSYKCTIAPHAYHEDIQQFEDVGMTI